MWLEREKVLNPKNLQAVRFLRLPEYFSLGILSTEFWRDAR
jgi:hypothetical protein